MPLVKVNMIRGKSSEYKKNVLDCIHVGLVESILVESLGIAPSDVFIVINEPPLENWGMGGIQKGYLI